MHDDGECDVRGVYTALAVASLTNILDDELRRGAAEWVASCQTYEGGIGATPGEEAHGGYTFCGLAAMVLLDSVEMLRLSDLTAWLVQRQMSTHGGFQGRCNKLVDGCYSFWQGGTFPLLEAALGRSGQLPAGGIHSLFSSEALLDYTLMCCQSPGGGLRDKPGRGRDYYHTCYCLSGLAVAASEPPSASAPPSRRDPVPEEWKRLLGVVNPVYNVNAEKVELAMTYFRSLPPVA